MQGINLSSGPPGGQMNKKYGTRSGLADPTGLKPFGSDDKQLLRAVIATPKGFHKLSGKEYRVLGVNGRGQARKLVKLGMQ
jgi:hypothetical protein